MTPEDGTTTPAPAGLLSIELPDRTYALPADRIAGVVPPLALRPLPAAPAGVLGLSERRGRILTVLDLVTLLGERPASGPGALARLTAPLDRLALSIAASVAFEAGEVDLTGVPIAAGSCCREVETGDRTISVIDLDLLLRDLISPLETAPP